MPLRSMTRSAGPSVDGCAAARAGSAPRSPRANPLTGSACSNASLLPNFTLVDDAVGLECHLIWKDDDGPLAARGRLLSPAPGGPRSPNWPRAPISTPMVASSRSMRWISAWTAAP